VDADYPCVCGHKMSKHRMDMIGSQGCTIYPNEHHWCGCYQFVPDNLMYLEMKANDR
jgi:hypothetical protein